METIFSNRGLFFKAAQPKSVSKSGFQNDSPLQIHLQHPPLKIPRSLEQILNPAVYKNGF
jgi:hypothetical protein